MPKEMRKSRIIVDGIEVELIVEPDGEGFHSFCPSLKGLHMDGRTEDEAIENAKDAVIAYLESLRKHNDPLPQRRK